MATKKPLSYDELRAEKSFIRIKPMALDLPTERVQKITTDLQRAAMTVLGTNSLLSSPKVQDRLKLFHKELFDFKHVELLPDLAWGTWYARIQTISADAKSTNIKVPEELIQKATQLKDRMMRVAEYWFSDDLELNAEVNSIRVGRGYVDLVTDLTRLAKVFITHRDVVAQDVKWYKPSDAEDADTLASEILGHLTSTESAEWADLSARVWTLLNTSYYEVVTATKFAFREDSTVKLPSLFPKRKYVTKAIPEEEQTTEDGTEDEPEPDTE